MSNVLLGATAMRQLEERTVESEVSLAVWSPKIDILALGFASGEVSLYRIVWQRIWSTGPENSRDEISDIRWRSDSKVLAVAYACGNISILDMESNVPVHRIKVSDSEKISFLRWITLRENTPTDILPTKNNKNNDKNSAWKFLTKFPDLSKAYSYNPTVQEETEDCKKLDNGGIQSLLMAGTEDGILRCYFDGFLYFSKMDLKTIIGGSPVQIKNATITDDLSSFCVIVSRPNESVTEMILFKMPIISLCFKELVILSEKYSILTGTMKYMSETIRQIREAWEKILLEMDTKLASYAKQLPEGGMTADFLELLMFGTPSTELEHFLLRDLTEKGLKKLGHSIEVSYSNVQRLVLKYLHAVSQSINFHLAEFLGVVKASENFAVLHVTDVSVNFALKHAAKFWNKGIELQQVIDESMKNFKAFFRWIYVEILKLSEETVSEELCKVSQQDIQFIAEFLRNFDVVSQLEADEEREENDEAKQNNNEVKDYNRKYLEKVGQYLNWQNLNQSVDRSKNPWCAILKDPTFFKDDVPFISEINEKSSLLHEHLDLKSSLNQIFENMRRDMTDKCQIIGRVPFPLISSGSSRNPCCQFNLWGTGIINGISYTSKELLFYKLHHFSSSNKKVFELKAARLFLPSEVDSILSAHFYTGDTIYLLISESPDRQKILQLPLVNAEMHLKTVWTDTIRESELCFDTASRVNAFDLIGQGSHRELENICDFSVSGPRKVAVFIFNNKKRIRIYEMEVEDEDEDEDNDTTLGTSGLSSDLNVSI